MAVRDLTVPLSAILLLGSIMAQVRAASTGSDPIEMTYDVSLPIPRS